MKEKTKTDGDDGTKYTPNQEDKSSLILSSLGVEFLDVSLLHVLMTTSVKRTLERDKVAKLFVVKE
jgi:hypothetical protein